jgi:hypothetical protein
MPQAKARWLIKQGSFTYYFYRIDISGRIYDLKSPADSFAEAPRAKPFGLARLPKIYLQERYQIDQVFG